MKNSKLMLLFTVLLSLPVFPSISKAEKTIKYLEFNSGVGQACFRCTEESRPIAENVQQIKLTWLNYDIVSKQIPTGYYARIESWDSDTERIALGYTFGFGEESSALLLFNIGGAYSEHRIGKKMIGSEVIINGQPKTTFDLGVSIILPIKKGGQYFSIGYNHLSNGSRKRVEGKTVQNGKIENGTWRENIGNEIFTMGLGFRF